MRKLFVSPHNDDETLFGAFTLLRERPLVVVVFDSYVQPARGIPGTDAKTRRAETERACAILGVECRFLGVRDDADIGSTSAFWALGDDMGERISRLKPTEVYGPAYEMGGHDHHNLVARVCATMPGKDQYLTYTRTRGKSTSERQVPILDPEWASLKLRALAEYKSQFQKATGCLPHFIGRSLEEFYA